MAAEAMNLAVASPLVRVASLSKTYLQRRWLSRERHKLTALDGVNLVIARGTTLALIGESGSGKSTLGRCLARLEEPDEGEIWFDGKDVLGLEGVSLRAFHKEVQLIFQDSASALNPRLSAAEIVSEPLQAQGLGNRRDRQERALELMQQVGLAHAWANRKPSEFSGGQRQRLAIARALSLEPKLLILDESLSALDLSIQAQIINLLLDLRELKGLTYLFIAHDLTLVGQIADEIAVIQKGRVVESGEARDLLHSPQHAYTRALLAASPTLDPFTRAIGQESLS